MICAYRAPSGDLEYFLEQLDIIFNSLQNPKMEFILCGDLNISCTGSNNKKTQLDNFLNISNLKGMVHFPTRITSTSFTSIDNIFIDKISNYTIKPYINGLSDHGARVLNLNDLCQPTRPTKYTYTRNLNKNNIADFQLRLSYEQWQDVFGVNDVNCMFNNFLNTYLRCYHSSFLIITKYNPNQTQNEG